MSTDPGRDPLPTGRLDGRAVLVTGAARGIGAATARGLASLGARLLLTDLDEAELRGVVKQITDNPDGRALALPADITATGTADQLITAALDAYGQLDVLVHVAGIMHDFKVLEQTPAEDLQPYLDVNVLAPYALTRAAAPALRSSPAGRVVFISSQWGQVPDGHSYGYMVSKAAQLGLMKTLAQELVADQVLVNAIAPGAVHTRMIPDSYYDTEVAAVPLGRVADPREIAAVVAFLASDGASFITGQTVPVNGGALLVGI